jgi:hypothetical protein
MHLVYAVMSLSAGYVCLQQTPQDKDREGSLWSIGGALCIIEFVLLVVTFRSYPFPGYQLSIDVPLQTACP